MRSESWLPPRLRWFSGTLVLETCCSEVGSFYTPAQPVDFRFRQTHNIDRLCSAFMRDPLPTNCCAPGRAFLLVPQEHSDALVKSILIRRLPSRCFELRDCFRAREGHTCSQSFSPCADFLANDLEGGICLVCSTCSGHTFDKTFS